MPDGGRVAEIGPGLGRTAYYANRMGLADYTLIDIPLSGAAQAHYLGSVLGPDAVTLWDETGSAPVRIAPPSAFLDSNNQFDLVVNIDSLTEMSRAIADAYWSRIQSAAPVFLSVNHEYNAFRFADLYRASGHAHLVQRTPYWLRQGYAEELVRFAQG